MNIIFYFFTELKSFNILRLVIIVITIINIQTSPLIISSACLSAPNHTYFSAAVAAYPPYLFSLPQPVGRFRRRCKQPQLECDHPQ